MSFKFDKSKYNKTGPDGAEEIIGGSIISDLTADGDWFSELPDEYDFVYYLSKEQFSTDEFEGPVSVFAVYRDDSPGRRVFHLDHKQFCRDLEDNVPYPPEDWEEINVLDELSAI